MGRKKRTSGQPLKRVEATPGSSDSLQADGGLPTVQRIGVGGGKQSKQSVSNVNTTSYVSRGKGNDIETEDSAKGSKGKSIVDDGGKVFDEKPAFRWLNLDDVSSSWGYFLFGHFAARFPSETALLKLCDSWNVKYHYYPHSSGMLVFGFENEQDRDTVLNGGPYFVYRRLLLLKVLPRCFEFDDDEISILPLWIQLPCLPLECWHPRALSKISSIVGKPICMDEITKNKEKVSYARVLVEVDVAKELVRDVRFILPNGKTRVQEVVYEFETKFCASCKMFGHLSVTCGVQNHNSASKEMPDTHQPDTSCSTAVMQEDAPRNHDETTYQQVSQQVQHLAHKVASFTVTEQSDHCSNLASETMVDGQKDERKVKKSKGKLVIRSAGQKQKHQRLGMHTPQGS